MRGRSSDGDRARSVHLPEGSAAGYAAWVLFVSLSEEGLRKRPVLLRRASAAGFVTTKTAKTAHRVRFVLVRNAVGAEPSGGAGGLLGGLG